MNRNEQEVDTNHRCLSSTFVITELSHHRTSRSAYGGSYFGLHKAKRSQVPIMAKIFLTSTLTTSLDKENKIKIASFKNVRMNKHEKALKIQSTFSRIIVSLRTNEHNVSHQRYYYIQGKPGEPYKIPLDKELVSYEEDKW